jgi:hypothetical protein
VFLVFDHVVYLKRTSKYSYLLLLLYSLPDCTTTARKEDTSVPVTVVLASTGAIPVVAVTLVVSTTTES